MCHLCRSSVLIFGGFGTVDEACDRRLAALQQLVLHEDDKDSDHRDVGNVGNVSNVTVVNAAHLPSPCARERHTAVLTADAAHMIVFGNISLRH